MFQVRFLGAGLIGRLANLRIFTCVGTALWVSLSQMACQSQTTQTTNSAERPPQDKPKTIELAGVETAKLTSREKEQWSTYVSELFAPCSDQPVSIAQCVVEKRKCDSCLPAARFLVKQVASGKTRTQAESAFRTRFAQDTVKTVDPGDAPSKGSLDAPVTIVEWADFECPFCAMAYPLLDSLAERYPTQVRLVFKNFPLAAHEHGEAAARAAVAASRQGKFWEVHHALFQNQKTLDDAGLSKIAREQRLDLKKFDEDRRSEAVADSVSKDRKAGEGLSLTGTPAIFINGRSFDLEHFDLAEDLGEWVALEIELRTGKPPLAGAQ
jgi:protein-disulfide isomerase